MIYDLIIIGGGQSALACAYYLRRANISYLLLDEQEAPGGAWQKAWDSLMLFSPAEHSSLPGWLMPKSVGAFPAREEVISYLTNYEKRYDFPVRRPVVVQQVTREHNVFVLRTSDGNMSAITVISATGTWHKPFIPAVPGIEDFEGVQLHSSAYRNAQQFKDKKVVVVGEGNSGAQIMADLSLVAQVIWATRKEPQYLPDEVDGRVLFDVASAKYYAEKAGRAFKAENLSLGHIVMVPAVKAARERDALKAVRTFTALDARGVVWPDGSREEVDAIIWCTGFRAALDHVAGLGIVSADGRIPVEGTRAINCPGLWLVGYGSWTGFASATLIGVGRSARETAREVQAFLQKVGQ